MRTPLLFLLCLIWSSVSFAELAPAASQETTVARQLAYSAKTHFDAGEYEHAASDAEAAYRLIPAPTLALLAARAKVELGKWHSAIILYRAAAGPTNLPRSSALVEAQAAALQELGKLESRLPRVRIHPPSARDGVVLIDETVIPENSYGVWFPYDPGRHTLTWKSKAGEEIRRDVSFAPGKRQNLRIAVTPPSPARMRERVGGIAALATGAVGVGLGIGFAVAAQDQADQLNAACMGFSCPEEEAENIQSYDAMRMASTVSYIVGFTGAAAGSFLLWRSLSTQESLDLKLTTSTNSLRLSGTF